MRKSASWEPIRRATVSVKWHGRGCLPDVDNIGGRTKAFLDGLTDARVWTDDRAVASIEFAVERVKKPTQPHVVLLIKELPDVPVP
jgi:Holliday junction resolvase RusA-like endonuclease